MQLLWFSVICNRPLLQLELLASSNNLPSSKVACLPAAHRAKLRVSKGVCSQAARGLAVIQDSGVHWGSNNLPSSKVDSLAAAHKDKV